MASTFSPILRIELIGTGDQSGTWGDTTNVNLGTLIEQAIAGTATIDVTAGNVTLSNFNGVTDQARCMALRTTGTPGVSRNLVAPAVSKIYVIANGSNSTVVLKTSTSTGLSVPSGEVYLAYYDPTVGTADFRLVGRASATANTPNTLVLRDGSGNFAAGTITATAFSGALNGTVGATTPSTGAFTTLSSTGNTTIGDTSGDTLTVNASPTFNVAIPATSGGTGFSSYAIGDIVFANTNATLAKLADVATGNAIISGGVGVAPSYGKIGLTTHVSGTLPVANGGTGSTTAATGTGGVVLAVSPALTGTPTAPTATPGTNTTQIATTAFVTNVAGSLGTMSTQNANAVAITGGTISGTTVNGNVVGANSVGARTIQATSAGVPTGGSSGDIVYQY